MVKVCAMFSLVKKKDVTYVKGMTPTGNNKKEIHT